MSFRGDDDNDLPAAPWERVMRERLDRAEAAIEARPNSVVLEGMFDQRDRQIAELVRTVTVLRAEVQSLREDCKRNLENHESSEFGKHSA